MRKLLFILLLVFQFCFSQEERLKVPAINLSLLPVESSIVTMNCGEGNEMAIADFKKGIYNYYTYGFSVSSKKNDAFDSFLKKYFKDNYAINYSHKGCVIIPESECYQKTMNKLIEEKFGVGFLDKKYEEASELYSKK